MTPQNFAPQAVTANNLVDGSVVFLRPDGAWSRRLADAAIADSDAASERLMQAALGAVADNDVVDPYLIALMHQDGALRAAHIREHLRTLGPSVLYQLAEPEHRAPSDKDAAARAAA